MQTRKDGAAGMLWCSSVCAVIPESSATDLKRQWYFMQCKKHCKVHVWRLILLFFIPLLHPNTKSCCFLMKVSKVKDFNLGCQSKIMEEPEGLTLLLFCVLTKAVTGAMFQQG